MHQLLFFEKQLPITCKKFQPGTDKAKTILAGTHKFVNIEIEVYYGENEETDLWKTSTISNRTSYDSMNETW